MKKLILFLLLLCNIFFLGANDTAQALDAKFNEKNAVDLANDFFTRLRENKPFTYEDELKYFGKNLASVAIMYQFGIVDTKTGEFVGSPPKYSYLCELIRLHYNEFILANARSESFSAGIKYGANIKNKFLNKSTAYATITYIQKTDDLQKNPEEIRQITIDYNVLNSKLFFSIIIDGKSFGNIIGMNENNYKLSPLLYEKLKKHMNSLQ